MKIVLFTQRIEIIESYSERRDCADQRISDWIYKCGYLPVPVPNNKDIAISMVSELFPDGIVLTGGNSLVKYGGNAPERDDADSTLLNYAVEKNIPVYGFCRGMQSILDYFGNSLTDVPGHVAVKHKVHGEIDAEVNSYHNQACTYIAPNNELTVTATSIDSVIEAVRHKELPIIGTMWHPEREQPYYKNDMIRLKNLIK